MNITILGCGHGGQALAAQLTLLGNTVTLHADESHPGHLHTIRNNTITLQGKLKASARLELLTTDIELALLGAEVIYLSLPTHAHLPQFRKMLPFLKKDRSSLPWPVTSAHFIFIKSWSKPARSVTSTLPTSPHCLTPAAPKRAARSTLSISSKN